MLTGRLASVLFLSFLTACGSTYYNETTSSFIIGNGVGGEYFAYFKKTKDECKEKAPEGIIGPESVEWDMFYVMVIPKGVDEKKVDIYFCDDTCEYPTDVWSGAELNEINQFVYHTDAIFDQKTKRYGAFAGNRMEVEVVVESAILYFDAQGYIYKKDPCEIRYYGVAEKVADYTMPAFEETEEGGGK